MIKTSTLFAGVIFSLVALQSFSQGFSLTISAPDTVADGTIYAQTKPKIALNASGNPVVVWGSPNDQDIFVSYWNGNSFSSPLKVNPDSIPAYSADWVGPNIAAQGDSVFVVWERPSGLDFESWIARSTDGGQTFPFVTRVDQQGNQIARYPSVTIVDGNPYVSYLRAETDLTNATYSVASSTDGGTTFISDVTATGNASGQPCECCPGQIFSNDSLIALIFRNNVSDHRDVSVAISENGGASYDSIFDIDLSNWVIATCPASGPRAYFGGDSLYAVFMTNLNPPSRVKFSAFDFNNHSQGLFTNIAPASPSNQNFPSINGRGDTLGVVWQETSAGTPDIWFNYSLSGGSGLLDTALNIVNAVDGIQKNGDIAYANGVYHIVYEDEAAPAVMYVTVSIDGVASVARPQRPECVIYPNPADDILWIKGLKGDFNYNVTDLTGRILLKGKIRNEGEINVNGLQTGLYHITLSDDQGIYAVTFLKN
jgi:hypothetical protein